jgi:hypothetical protein
MNQAPTRPQNPTPTQTLQPADQTPAPAPEDRALAFAIKIYAMSPEGFVCEITSAEQSRPAVFIAQMCDGLGRLHFTPIDPFQAPTVDVDVAAPAAAGGSAPAAGGGAATWIKGDAGTPPKCSLHGTAKWIEGVWKEGQKGPVGETYSFWACKVQGCRPKGDPK